MCAIATTRAARPSPFRAPCSNSSADSHALSPRVLRGHRPRVPRARIAGSRRITRPASVVVHFEGVTSGTDTSSGIKRYQVVNQEKFVERWKAALPMQPKPGTRSRPRDEHRVRGAGADRRCVRPEPDQDSGSVRLVNLMRLLVRAAEGRVRAGQPRRRAEVHARAAAARRRGAGTTRGTAIRRLAAAPRRADRRGDRAAALHRGRATYRCCASTRRERA